ncbi:hypothetical protein R6242_20325 [Iodobacter sp. CM08]|uniref:hypothetical protein n=1 Tax=Iodobacter sp. CM08 TaxID=3085902 RepID=UPI0029815EFD|nr:hypothetical protein [Iodobacter sp. CM08]MDW5418922.1 hypothetical protein [Iodobacter sp. CM08]
MSDSIDRACELAEMLRINAITQHFEAAKLSQDKTPIPNGECRWCEAEAVNDAVFCCDECAKDWQERNAINRKAKRIAGC